MVYMEGPGPQRWGQMSWKVSCMTSAQRAAPSAVPITQSILLYVVVVVVDCFTWGVWGHVANGPALQRAYHGGLPTRPKAFKLPQTS